MARIIVVDDSDEIRETISEMLTDAGHSVVTAADYESGREFLEKGGIDLVICDMGLPLRWGAEGEEGEMSIEVGANAIAEFVCDFPGIPVIAISGLASEQNLKVMERYGACAVLPKPFGEDTLLRTVQEALKSGNKSMTKAAGF